MGAARIQLQPGFVLHGRPYRDSSLLLEVFTAEHGRFSLVAKGARRRARGGSAAALLQPFTPLLLSCGGRSELKTLVHAEPAGTRPPLRGERMFSGIYLNELLIRLLHRHDAHPRLFLAYDETLQALAQNAAVDAVLRRFELTLLEELGYGFQLDVDGGAGTAVVADASYRFDPDCGMVQVVGVMEQGATVYAGADLLAMADGRVDGAVARSAKLLLREVLATHLGALPLRSRELFRSRRVSGAAPTGGTDDLC